MKKEVSVWTALVTPFQDGSLDFDSFETLLKDQAKAKTGVVLFGSTGEGLALTLEEKQKLLERALAVEDIPFLVGLPGFQWPQVESWIKWCNQFPVAGYLAPVPMYAKPGIEGQREWFSRILDAADVPVMLYNIPSRSGIALSEVALHALQDHPRLWALKDSGGDQFQSYQRAAPNLTLYAGDDSAFPLLAPLGAKGIVSIMSNVWPAETQAYATMCLKEGHVPEWVKDLDAALFKASNPVPIKALLAHLGKISSPEVRPPLSHRDLKDLSQLIALNSRINNP